ncbi:condensation domain-containing protein [Streptomyces sp. NBC_01216]|uniref:condensation domain-containing protein n=1 Tax=unclassified Streptomyces TaxID=2593676 RepID=UPI002E0ED29D|nr:condensation domain-containing protein [Streptomyces sp. NBC_01216]
MTTLLSSETTSATGSGADTPERACARCGISGRYPGIAFDPSGTCDLCTMYERHGPEIDAYFGDVNRFVSLVRARAEAGGSDVDCLLLYSGGKDSSYVLYRLIDLGLRVRTFTFDNGFISKTALRNVETITSELGIEHVTATHADQNKVFLRSLQQHKSVCNGCFRSLLDLSTRHAHDLGIPTIVTGLSRGQIMDERLSWFHRQGIFDPAEIEPGLREGRRVYHQAGGDIAPEVVDSVEVVDYYRYSDVTKDGIRALLHERSDLWSQPGDTGFCSSNCMINDAGVLVHTRERGFHNYEAPTRWEVRLGHLERAEADEELRMPAATPRVRKMLLQIGYPLPEEGVARPTTEAPAAERTSPAPAAASASTSTSTSGERRAALTPAQRQVLARAGAAPGPHGRALLLEAKGAADPALVRRSTLALLLHHEALRLRFAERDGGWEQYDTGVAGALPVLRLDLSGRDAAAEAELLRTAVDRMRSRMSLSDGPLVQLALADRGPLPARLLLVVHELLADTRSWRVLLRDLSALWAAGGETPLAPAESFLRRAAAVVSAESGRFDRPEPGLAGPSEPGVDREEAVLTRVDCGAPASATRVAAALSAVLADLGDEPGVEVLDHTAEDRPRGVGRWSLAPAPPSDAPELIRYEHFGDLEALLPDGSPFSLVAVDTVDFTVLPGTGRDVVTVNGVVRQGVLHLDWWCPPGLRGRLLAASIPERVARRLTSATDPAAR